MMYYSDGVTGIVSLNEEEFNRCIKDASSILTGLRMKRVLSSRFSEKKCINSIYIHPIGNKCYGSCSYCYCKTQPKDNLYLTKTSLIAKLQEIIDTGLVVNPTTVRLSGGNPLIYPELESLMDTCIDKLGSNINFRVTSDLINPREDIQRAASALSSIASKINGHIVFAMSVDFGNNQHMSSHLNIQPSDVYNNADSLIHALSDYDNIYLDLYSNIFDHTCLSEMLDFLRAYLHKRCRLSLGFPNYDRMCNLDWDVTRSFLNTLDEEIGLLNINKMEVCLDSKRAREWPISKIKIEKLSENTFLYSPNSFVCNAYSHGVGFNPLEYFSCFFGDSRHHDLKNAIVLNEKEGDSRFTSFPKECWECSISGVCNRCSTMRHMLPCSVYPIFKQYYLFLWGIISKNIVERKNILC